MYLLLFVFECVCLCVYVIERMNICGPASYGGQRTTLGVGPQHVPLFRAGHVLLFTALYTRLADP